MRKVHKYTHNNNILTNSKVGTCRTSTKTVVIFRSQLVGDRTMHDDQEFRHDTHHAFIRITSFKSPLGGANTVEEIGSKWLRSEATSVLRPLPFYFRRLRRVFFYFSPFMGHLKNDDDFLD